ncbi:hypothetical protein Ddye_022777 [Dipteronia dyeriana]|uniref:RRM domain-containing protein n=1 Tax=Dipteronia dyeriana TaxID=168575 RepID=A0AAD9TSK5_9ROSI|nr:hypothetical protein Ddye_022777 [Dipteronia dyeriana]
MWREKVSPRESGGLGGARDFRSNLVSIFEDNLNPKVDQKSLWGIFRPFDFVRDLYLSPKSRSRKSCFAFVRFSTKEEAERFIELMNGMHVFGWPISSNIASLDWSSRKKDYGKIARKPVGVKEYKTIMVKIGNKESSFTLESSYAEAVRGSNKGLQILYYNGLQSIRPTFKESLEVAKWDEEAHDNSWLKSCAIGVLKLFSDISLVVKGLCERKILSPPFYLGDKNILWAFELSKDRDVFIRNRLLWGELFSSVGAWNNAITPQSRLSWVDFGGIPLHVWCKDFFMRLGWAIGEPLLIEDETLHRKILYRGKILVLIPFGHRSPGVIKVDTKKSLFSVSVWKDPAPVNIEWISNRLGIGSDVSLVAKDVGTTDIGDRQEFPRQFFFLDLRKEERLH